MLGRVPRSLVDDEECLLLTDHEGSLELRSLRRVADNAQKQYLRSRPGPSPESIKRVKDLDTSQLGLHPLFSERRGDAEGGDLSPHCWADRCPLCAHILQVLALKTQSWRG